MMRLLLPLVISEPPPSKILNPNPTGRGSHRQGAGHHHWVGDLEGIEELPLQGVGKV